MMKKKINLLFHTVIKEISSINNCGIVIKNYQLDPIYGNGSLISYSFDGLYVEYFQATLYNNYVFSDNCNVHTLELSYLLSGEKTVCCTDTNEEFIQQEQEALLFFSNGNSTKTTYFKEVVVKEIRFKMFYEFIKKHQLSTLVTLLQKGNHHSQQCIFSSAAFCHKTQCVISEILSDNRTGFLKRLFLEAKTLELVSLLHQSEQKSATSESVVKKLYTVQKIICANLNEQFSTKQLARKVLLNDTVLKKEYKRIFNTSISEYSLLVRMKKAKELLSLTSKPIYEISDLVGYKNPTHFSAAFKKQENLTPKQFRNTVDPSC